METKNVFHNAEKTAQDIAKCNEILIQLQNVEQVLQAENISTKHALSVIQDNYSLVYSEFIAKEAEKLQQAGKLIGFNNAVMEIAKDRIIAEINGIITDLKAKIKPLNWRLSECLQYFEFVNDCWKLKKGFEAQISEANSIILTEPAEIKLYQKHCKLVDLLNELKSDDPTLTGVINKLVYFDTTSKQFSINYKLFDKNNVMR